MASDNAPAKGQSSADVLDGLSQLWGNLPNPNAPPAPLSPTMQPGYPGGPPIMSGVTGGTRIAPVPYAPNTVPTMAPTTALPPAAAAPKQPIPPATDDPEMAASRQRFHDTTDQFNQMLQQGKTAQSGIAANPPVDPSKYRPSIGQKLLAIALSTMAGAGHAGPQAETQIADEVTGRDLRRAQATRETAIAPFLAQQNAVERQVPLLNAANESAWREYQAGMEGQKENLAERKQTETEKKDTDLSDIKRQLADVAKLRESDQKASTLEKLSNDLEARSRALDLKQMSVEQQARFQDLSNQLKEQKLQADQQKFTVGTDAKSLEAERKARLASIEDDWKAHPIMNKLFGDKNKEIATVNQDINGRLTSVMTGANGNNAPTGGPSAANPPQKGYTRIKASDGSLHDIPSQRLKDAKARDPKLTIITQ